MSKLNRLNQAQQYQQNFITGLGAAGAGTYLVGLGVDAFTGEAGTFNSGELPQNIGTGIAYNALGAGLGTAAGAGLGLATRSNRRAQYRKDLREIRKDPKYNKRATNQRVGQEAKEVMKKDGEAAGREYFAANKFDEEKANYLRDIEKGAARQSARDGVVDYTLRGAAIGQAAMLVPSLMSMRDEEKLAQQSAELM